MTKEDIISPAMDKQHEQVVTVVTAKSHYDCDRNEKGKSIFNSGKQQLMIHKLSLFEILICLLYW